MKRSKLLRAARVLENTKDPEAVKLAARARELDNRIKQRPSSKGIGLAEADELKSIMKGVERWVL